MVGHCIYLVVQAVDEQIEIDDILFKVVEISQMLQTNIEWNDKSNIQYTQLVSSTSNIVDQSLPRRLVGQPRRE